MTQHTDSTDEASHTNDPLDDGTEPRFCAPADFGDWHLTADGETTLCGEYDVDRHHMSGTFDVFRPVRDCTRCYRIYRTDYCTGGVGA